MDRSKMAIWNALVSAVICVVLSGPVFGQENPGELTGKVGNYSAYFLDKERVRHHRYELYLNQKTNYSFRFTSMIEARFRFDAAMLDDENATEQNIAKDVREDELSEGEVRQAYFDYLGDLFRATIGIQKIDWVESLSAASNDIMTPLDYRHGGFGDSSDLVVPVGAASVNHKLFDGSLEWLVVPLPKASRFGKGRNGYGFYELLEEQFDDDIEVIIQDEEIPKGIRDTEAGLRYLLTFEKSEFTLFGYRGHHRKPVFQVEETGPEQFTLTTIYPRVNTYGFFWSYASDATVLRLMAFHQPNRTQTIVEVPAPDGEQQYQVRSRVGLGFDYVFSRHLKLYTEQFYTSTEDFPHEEDSTVESDDDTDSDTGLFLSNSFAMVEESEEIKAEQDRNPRNDYSAMVRLGNETFKTVEFSVDATYQSPNKAHIIAPTVMLKAWDQWELNFGARLIKSWHDASAYEPIKNSSHVWSSVYRSF